MNRGRPKGSRNKKTAEFCERYDALQRRYKFDPVEFLFAIAANDLPGDVDEDGNEIKPEIPRNDRMLAAKELLPYRFARRRHAEIGGPDESAAQVQLVIKMGDNDDSNFQLPAKTAAGSATQSQQ